MINGLGKRLSDLRQLHNLSQSDVGLKVGVSNLLISKYETGYHQPPIDVIVKLAKLYHTTTDYIIGIEAHRTIILDGISPSQKEMIDEVISVMACTLAFGDRQ